MSKLHVDSITKSFDEKKVLKDIYISCEKGKVVGLLGRNGTGKSTLLKIIFGIEKGDSQFIRVDNKVLQNQMDRKGRIAYLPQYSLLPRGVKVKDMIMLFCTKENSDTLFESELIKPFLHKTSKHLSAGEKKIVEVLLIIHSDSKFVLLDEPFNTLSPKITFQLQEIIREQSKQKGIIISDHRFQEVLDISDEVYLLSNGYLKQIKDLKELQQYNYLPKSI
ncbi:lipopolysaccharide export system ATP-binding protein [Chryseobacterium ginsenosidimutans]|uniref:ATP-binding cassette domain-containing protein n=1 Tax=Chryseobacterium ginsenosidimutans TaxID=687846 RepID=UPI002787C5D6|nr:ATP-binding cassette domain-containing protein [Chryseobacterium ginsenosidimutans]MDQ0593241.1 lipopolysaccharide export system ATP-binding protein [Chryseobacterium ginsenosidimutans]